MVLRKVSNVSCGKSVERKGGFFSPRTERTYYTFFYKEWKREVSESEFEKLQDAKDDEPVAVMKTSEFTVWWFGDEYYVDNDGLSSEEVLLTLWDRSRKRQRKFEKLRAEAAAIDEAQVVIESQGRARISSEVKRIVFERDGGACAKCGATTDLQFDHIIPVSRGGNSSSANLQVLCGSCNRKKSDTIA